MAPILGKSLLERTWRIAGEVKAPNGVKTLVRIATDSLEIAEFARAFGAEVLMTSEKCRNGTERVFEALGQMPEEVGYAINLQGDAVLTPPWILEPVIRKLVDLGVSQECGIVTPSAQLTWGQMEEFLASKSDGRTSGTLVVRSLAGRALYFSKATIPHLRKPPLGVAKNDLSPYRRHIGLYGYTRKVLEAYCRLSPSPLEECEQLEQLRALENGLPIYLVEADYRGRSHWSIDNPEDVRVAEEIIRREGELL